MTLTPKGAKTKLKGKEKATAGASLIDLDTPLAEKDQSNGFDAWEDSAKDFMPSTNLNYSRASVDTARPAVEDERDESEEDQVESPRVLDIVRIPRSKLQFFPKHRPPDPRTSLDSSTRSVLHRASRSNGQTVGPSIQNDLSTLPLPLQTRQPTSAQPLKQPHSGKIVRLRPSSGPSMNTYTQTSQQNTFANRISSLFTVPPPPSNDFFTGRRASSSASITLSLPGSGASTPARSHTHTHHEAPLELRPRSSFDIPDRSTSSKNGHHRSASVSKKLD